MLAAIKQHRSQRHVIYDRDASDEEWMKVLTRESWIIAWPPRVPDQPMLRDMFDGLE